MAKTLFELVQDYLNQKLPDTFTYGSSGSGGNQPPVDDDDDDDVVTIPGVTRDLIGRDDGPMSAFSAARKNYLNPYAKIGDVVPGLAGKGLQALQDMLPVNPRAIYENELRNQGVITDDIGRIVADPTENYNTIENVMAGYNANKITQETIDKRIDRISKTLKEKYKMSPTEIKAAIAGTYDGPVQTNLIDQIKAVSDYGKKFVSEQGPVKMKSNVVETQLRLGKGEDVSTMPIAPPSLAFGNPNLDAQGNIEILDIVGGGKKNTIASSKDDDDSAGIPEAPTTFFNPGQGFVDQGGLGEFGIGAGAFPGGVPASSIARAIQQVKDDRATIGNITSAPRTSANIAKSRDALAREYDREVARGERKDDPTIQSNINKAKAKIGMPQMLGDVGGGDDKGGGGGKIVCTMMNESYGFGSFRNKIWLRHSKGLAPEYQKGYHKIFLPLVKLSKKNYVLKKVLEHIAVHRTIDIRQESRNKIHLLGRIYRKVLEPICYLVGKYGKD
jgi:hypothetical protein